jgi:hypothetical protein
MRDWQFSAGTVAILAHGIGANAAVFSILNNTTFEPQTGVMPTTLVARASRDETPLDRLLGEGSATAASVLR